MKVSKKWTIVLLLTLFATFFSLSSIDIKASGWGFSRNNQHVTPSIGKYAEMIEGTSSYYVGDTSQKIVYLTFDAGYDNGELIKILNTLEQKNVKASFFLTGDFVKRFPELTIKITLDGHIPCNHSYSHRRIQTLTKDELANDLEKLNQAYYDLTGHTMPKYFRPPEGEFSREALLNVQSLGYKTIFWSYAYRDWDVNHQQSSEKVVQNVVENLHPGAIILMHSVSSTNSEALGLIIDEIRNAGYEFKTVLSL